MNRTSRDALIRITETTHVHHQLMWGYAHFEGELREAGLDDVRRAQRRDSPVADPNIDVHEEHRRPQSLYVDATRRNEKRLGLRTR
jgi:hypothetical protein